MAAEPLPSTRGHAEAYARSVIAGTAPACKWIKMACARHLRDLETGHQRGLWFDHEAEERIYAFFEKYLRHSKGEFAKKPFVLQQWQAFIVGSVFGWKRMDGSRRFRTVYDEEPRKNGKSTRLAGIGHCGLLQAAAARQIARDNKVRRDETAAKTGEISQ